MQIVDRWIVVWEVGKCKGLRDLALLKYLTIDNVAIKILNLFLVKH